METIVDGRANVIRLLGKQCAKETHYRMMNYVIQGECEDGVLLHNSITGQLVLLNDEEASLLNSLPGYRTEAMTGLIENHFLVPLKYDERDVVKKLRHLLVRLDSSTGIESYTILTTTNCNARCFYCYESDLPRLNMDEETAEKLVDYMVKHKGNKSLKLHWFGGEPLVCANRIDQICETLRMRNVDYVSSMTSNGYLFTEEMAEKAATLWKLDCVQITLDGTEETYNRTKAYVGIVGSPYQRVMKNIQMLISKGIRVIIRLNLDKHNADDLMNLVAELNEVIENREKIEVYSHVLFEDAGFAPIERDEDSRTMLYNLQLDLNRKLENARLGKRHRTLPVIKTHGCMADTDRAAVIYPDGRMFKCEHVYIGDEYGSIDTDITNEEGINKFKRIIELDICESCPLYPSCILLENCQGVPDKNKYTCKYEVERTVCSLSDYYQRYKSKREKA